ncbi:nitrate reductase formation protein NapD [Colwellia sp. MT41]|uniref:Chaperone NapD n=1 Tax=Colwellia marinimaniae TaxID=1513592 RepID=A0ABQ0MZP6_9GAMM|nr:MULTISPECIES: chaperone NapD [Colwellia]ALO33991.1 nitrate reductase formation protein NapD [Colwellia sp. MT41]GAW97842.1 sorbose reductase [Colwellia marinimaniae]
MTQSSNSQTSEYHVASLIASCILAQVDEVKAAILAVDDTEIHVTSAEGKIVFTIEGTSHKDIGKKMDILRVHTGILNLSPVYHQVLDESVDDDATKQ